MSKKKAWVTFKKCVVNPPVLSIFDPRLPIVIYCDASKDGLGCCLLQNKKPVAYASRSLSQTEKRYAQIEKELLVVYFACHKFHQLIYDYHTLIFTDHKPLITIFKKEINDITARLQRFKLGLLKYDVELQFVPGKKNLLADPLSRLYMGDEESERIECTDIVHEIVVAPEKTLLISPEKQKLLKIKIKEDNSLVKLLELYQNGWNVNTEVHNLSTEIGKYIKEKNHITVSDGLIFYNNQVIVPKKGP